jgi:2-desacetyl-2-hydroxyethyl bacteriochlorophyllide A dehydrogenase
VRSDSQAPVAISADGAVETMPELPETMRAAVLLEGRELRVVSKPLPVPGTGEVLVRVAMCGACGTDLTIQDHPFPGQPPFGEFTPGHEWTGTVVRLGDTVDEVDIGDRVGIHAHRGCGRCRNCLLGGYTSCLNYGDRSKGHRATGFTADGGFAEYVVHHVSALYRLPANVSWEDAVLVSTAGTAMYGIDRAGGLVAGDTVVVIGPGPVGLMAAQVAGALGAGPVILVGTREERLELGRGLGVPLTVNARTHDPVAEVLRLTGGRGADLVIESSGNSATPNQSLSMVRRGGTVLFLGFYKDPVPFDLGRANREEVNLVTSRGEGRMAVGRALRLAESGVIRGAALVTHRFALDDIQAGFDVLRDRDGTTPVKLVFVP